MMKDPQKRNACYRGIALLYTLQEWSDLNKLKLNPSECQAMQIYFGKNEIHDVSLNISDSTP